MLPLIAFSASAELATYGEQDFESIEVGKTLAVEDGLGGVPTISSVMEETDGNRYARIPFVGEEEFSDTSNWDKSLTAKHEALNSGDSFTFEVSYRPHFNGAEGATPTVEAQFLSYSFRNPSGNAENGIYMNLYTIDLSTGRITGCGEIVEGAENLVLDEWNTVKMVFYPATSAFKLYVNGALYSVQTAQSHVTKSFANTYHGDCTDVKITANQLILAKCNKNQGAYVASSQQENATYIDVDNIRVYETEKIKYTLNGEEVSIGEGSVLNLAAGNKKLLWANVELPNGDKYTTENPLIQIEEGMKIDSAAIEFHSLRTEARLCKPTGIRFITQIKLAELEALRARENVKDVELGTAIVPTLFIKGIGEVSYEIMKNVEHVMIPMQDWYSLDERSGDALFVGSIANIKEENYNREYSGVGYMKITFEDGTESFVYASSEVDYTNTVSLTQAAKKQLLTGRIKGEAEVVMKELKEKYSKENLELYAEDLKGLNVLALGDSLFSGTIGYPQSSQWVNKIGRDCDWNLTNLGIGSMTVSFTDRNNKSDHGNKNSMYDWMFNGKNDFRWGSESKNTNPNPFFTAGNPDREKPENVDLIILEGGCNDYGTAIAAPLGTLDSKDPATFLGAWNCITERLLTDYPNATIVFLTTWRLGPQKRDGDTLTSIEFSESVIDLYKEKYADNGRIALIDAGNPMISGVNMQDDAWRSEYSTDSYHLKDSGMTVIANNMLPLLWQIMKNTGKID